MNGAYPAFIPKQTPHLLGGLFEYLQGFWEGIMHKIANYRRAVWLVEEGHSLEEIITAKLADCPDVAATKFEYRAGVDVQIADRSTDGDGLGCYFTLFSEGTPAATVDNGGSNVHRRAAPAGEEFLRTGIYLVIAGNHVGYVANGHTNDGQITGLLHKFLEQKGAPKNQTEFHLMARADRREIERLLRVGVKSIDLGMSSFMATIEDINNTAAPEPGGVSNFIEGARDMGRGLMKIIGHDRPPHEAEAASEIQARVHLGYDGRNANALLPIILAKIGNQIHDQADEFKIITRQDVVITRDRLVVKRDVDVEGDEIALVPASAFAVLRVAMSEWHDAGLLDQ